MKQTQAPVLVIALFALGAPRVFGQRVSRAVAEAQAIHLVRSIGLSKNPQVIQTIENADQRVPNWAVVTNSGVTVQLTFAGGLFAIQNTRLEASMASRRSAPTKEKFLSSAAAHARLQEVAQKLGLEPSAKLQRYDDVPFNPNLPGDASYFYGAFWVKTIKGYPVVEPWTKGMTIALDAATGELLNAWCDWDYSFPLDTTAPVVSRAMAMKLGHATRSADMTLGWARLHAGSNRASLAWRIRNSTSSESWVDAVTGKAYLEDLPWLRWRPAQTNSIHP